MNQIQNTKSLNILQAIGCIFVKYFSVSPTLFLSGFILNVLDGISFGLMVLVMQCFMDEAFKYANHTSNLKNTVYMLIGVGTFYILKNALNGIAYLVNLYYMRKVDASFFEEMNLKMSRISPYNFEDGEILADINKSNEGMKCASKFVNSILLSVNVYIPYFLCMTIYLWRTDSILPLALLFVFLPTLLSQIQKAVWFCNAEYKLTQVRREADYYEECIVDQKYFKETRIKGGYLYFINLLKEVIAKLNILTFKAHIKSNITELISKLLSLAGYIGILLLLFRSLMSGKISAGAFAAIFASVGQMFSMMEDMICKHYGSAANNLGKVRNFIDFLHMKEDDGTDVKLIGNEAITLSNVSFTYPSTTSKAIDNMNFTIKNGETIALVGENGSGKSTLVRLITGIYLPNEGDVLHGTISTRYASRKSIFQNTSAVFQKFQKYHMTLRDNIGISDVNEPTEDEILKDVCDKAGIIKAGSEPLDNYDIMLSREFDGIDLSGGQWQRVAIARGLFRRHNTIVLDEPTSAIDPIEETNTYKFFLEIAAKKTCIIVTHRLGLARYVDKIYVMKQGKIVEQGTHDELINTQGEYSRLYKSQEQWYLEGDTKINSSINKST